MSKITAASLLLIPLLVAGRAEAAVVINEIAWMGTSASANAEWIELHNTDGSVVDLTGWTLIGTGGSPNVVLSGSIPGNGFYLLERTSDATVPGVSAGVIYTGALANTGLTLTLKDGSGATIDTVVGGTNWSAVGGDNDTKQTAQRSGSSWVTAEATPGLANTTSNTTGATSTTGVTQAEGRSPIPELSIDGVHDRTLATRAAARFRAIVYDDDGRVHEKARVRWSFGDGAYDRDAETRHAYREPGEYVLAVKAESRLGEVERLFVMTVHDAHIEITTVGEKGIQIANRDNRLLDLSEWELTSGVQRFVIPEGTYVLPSRSVIFPATVTGIATTSTDVALRYPGGEVATLYGEAATTTETGIILLPPRAILAPQPLALSGGNQEMRALPVNPDVAYGDGIIAPAAVQVTVAGAPLAKELGHLIARLLPGVRSVF